MDYWDVNMTSNSKTSCAAWAHGFYYMANSSTSAIHSWVMIIERDNLSEVLISRFLVSRQNLF
jgi:hypothetical protein